MRSSEFVVLFTTPPGESVSLAGQFVRAARVLCAGALRSGDVGVSCASGALALVLHLDPEPGGVAVRERLEFWAARCGGTVAWESSVSQGGRSLLAACDLRRDALAPADLSGALDALLRKAGLDAGLFDGGPCLDLDLGARSGDGLRFEDAQETLFVPALRNPPVGDAIALRVTPAGGGAPSVATCEVIALLRAGQAGPGSPAGFVVRFTRLPRAAREALLAHGATPPGGRRAGPRFRVNLPARVAGPRGDLREDAFAAVRNLSQGGALLVTRAGWRAGERVRIAMQLPWGATFHAEGVVTNAGARGAGVRFELDEDGEQALTEILQRITARPRTAVVVDDDALARRMLSDALAERGFAVRCASEALGGIHLLAEHLLETDLLVTDVRMHAMDGEALVRTIREAGGERDLAIVGVTGSWGEGVAARLREAGAQALLDKALGAELIARAAEAIVARRAPDCSAPLAASDTGREAVR